MKGSELLLMDQDRRVLGKVEVDRTEGTLRVGRFFPLDWPEDLRNLFNEYDELINDQVLAALDDIEEKIEACGFCVSPARSADCTPITDLQISRDNRISFRLLTPDGDNVVISAKK
jgi:hypothetical protein